MERKYFKNLTRQEREEIKQKIFQELDLENRSEVRRILPWKRVAAVAVAASLIAVATLLVFRSAKQPLSARQLIAQTSAGEIKQVVLADSSIVILNPLSALYSNPGYITGHREVFLEGNGFFKVKKMNVSRNFIVHAGSQSVTVLGTQFNVNARKGVLEVVLTSGSVKITADSQTIAPAFMQPGDKVTYTAGDENYQKSNIDPLLYSPWIQGEWKFRNTPLNDIAKVVSEYYNVSIQFDKPEAKNLKMTAVFPVTKLETLLEVIMETLPVTITRQQQQLIIQ